MPVPGRPEKACSCVWGAEGPPELCPRTKARLEFVHIWPHMGPYGPVWARISFYIVLMYTLFLHWFNMIFEDGFIIHVVFDRFPTFEKYVYIILSHS